MDVRGETTAHATTIAVQGKGVMIRGASGSGKSSVGLQLLAQGAELVSDDRTIVVVKNSKLMASPPAALRGLIEARGIGLLRRGYLSSVPVDLIVDLDHVETERLPPLRETSLLGVTVPLLHKVVSDAWPSAIYTYLTSHRVDPEAPHVI